MPSNEENVALHASNPNIISTSALPSPSRARLLATAGFGNGPTASNEAHTGRLNVFHRVQEACEARNSPLYIGAISLVNLPQIIAAAVILASSWQNETLCFRIQVWVLLHTIHLALTLLLAWILYYLDIARSINAIRLREQYMTILSRVKFGLDLAGTSSFLVGNKLVFSDSARCNDGSAMYQLALWMVIISYAKLFLPCLLLLALLPFLYFCLPCVIRLLSRLQDLMRREVLTQEVGTLIDQLETKTYTSNMFPPEDACCCICLDTYKASQSLRVLPCAHHFHKECVGKWLLVNSTCPTCRKSMFAQV
ncbi:hypothetical protein DD238_008387 [Peronospora effusa]|uniref:RING-type domain-containing protein n=1 Tax=Peronospora effusa TaxID=542832 RepID=A0A3M6VUS7_9STRA|nr:hypothetical protein DD238_008387 [Peronospora effusa]RQM11707.1 hypothetical protein DD237_008474 [Peronospora effusa]